MFLQASTHYSWSKSLPEHPYPCMDVYTCLGCGYTNHVHMFPVILTLAPFQVP